MKKEKHAKGNRKKTVRFESQEGRRKQIEIDKTQ
jgi:hypothetical protein